MFTVHFKDVGRNKETWDAKMEDADEASLARAVRKKGALCSSGIDCEKDDTQLAGVVLVGGWRPVGTFTIE